MQVEDALREVLQIIQILVATTRSFVYFQMLQTDQIHLDIINSVNNPVQVAFTEADSGNSGHDFYSHLEVDPYERCFYPA